MELSWIQGDMGPTDEYLMMAQFAQEEPGSIIETYLSGWVWGSWMIPGATAPIVAVIAFQLYL